jgi:ubiquinone/menaquinone biosynthesis C-methylase UbiE
MARLSFPRRILKLFHPEGIPWPGTAFYDRISATDIFRRSYARVARDIAQHCASGRLLDIGTGPGRLLLALQAEAPALQITGLDISAAMAAKARENLAAAGLAGQIEIQEGSADRLPFEPASFDVVVSTGSIHHWKASVAGVDEVHRALKPGGWALLYDILSDTPAEVLRAARREFGRLRVLMLWLHAFEEPFYAHENFARLGLDSRFQSGETRFVGVLCCLTLRKDSHA